MLITGLILAGGRGTRMGTVDKGLQQFRGEPMVQHVMKRLAPQVQQLMISANQNLDVYRSFGIPVWSDETPDFAGPMAGLEAGLRHCTTPYIVTAPCDSPFVPADFVARMRDALEANNADLAIAVTGAGNTRQVHPVFCLAKADLLPDLTAYLQNGGRKVQTWYGRLKFVEVHFADEDAFRNINTLDELRSLESD
jgi:molybdopterin-guanine dinucleotide biosynthesis protein A